MGLLDDFTQFIKTPEGQGLLSGAAGWAAGARKGTPWNNIGRGGLAGLSGYASAQDQAMQMSQAEQAKALREMQIAQMRQQFADAELDRGFDPSKFVVPAKPAEMSPSTANAFGLPAQPDQAAYVDKNAMIAEMMRRSPAMKMKALEMMTKEESPLVVGNNLVTKNGKLIFSPPPDPMKMSKAEELAQRHQDRIAEIRAAAALRPAPAEKMVTAMDENGNPFQTTQAEMMANKYPAYTPAIAKSFQAKKEKDAAKAQMSDALGELKGFYEDLNNKGGMTSTTANPLSNIAARVGSSSVGQMVGGALGTENQSTRQKIEMTRPSLMQLIKKSTGMSAQEMNSNAELQLYLKTATDPTATYEANMNALKYLDKTFGLGIIGADSSSRESGGKIGKTVVKTGTYNGKKVIQYSDGSVGYAD